MRSAAQIAELFYERRQDAGTERQRMRDACSLYQGDIAIDLSELSAEERPAVVNYMRMGTNQLGMRAAGVMPMIEHLQVEYGRQDYARKKADLRRKVNHGWWGASKQNLILRKRARWMFAYAKAPVLMWPDMKTDMPMWQARSPLDTYAAPLFGVGDCLPVDAIFAQTRTVGWVRRFWPEHSIHFLRSKADDLVDVLEYTDADQFSKVLCLSSRTRRGDIFASSASDWIAESGPAVMLTNIENRVGRPWAVILEAISLERPVGLYEGMFGMYQHQAKLQALSMIARQRGVFQEEWLVASGPGETPDIIRKADAMTGEVGIVTGGRFERVSPDPQYATDTGIDRMSRDQRVEAGVPAAYGGEGISNTRSGRGVETVLGAATDPLLQEAHELFAMSLLEENKIAIGMDKAYWGSESKRLFVAFNGDKCNVDYVPNDLWETDQHLVRYPYPGGDVDSINIATGQAVGAGVMSRRTAARLNPLVDNPEAEFDQITVERLQDAFFAQVQQMASTPGGGFEPIDLIRFMELVGSDRMEIIPAFRVVQGEAQRRQAAQAETPDQMQPGVSPPGAGVEQPGAFNATPDQAGLSKLLFSLRAPQMRSAAESV